MLPPIINHERTNLAATLNHSHNHRFVFPATSGDLSCSLSCVHIPSFSTDEGFIYLDLAREFHERPCAHRVPNSMEHEPSASLHNFDIAGDLVGRNAILAIGNQPHCA